MNDDIKKVLYYFALKYNGDFDKIYSSLRTRESFDVDEFMKLKKDVQHQHITLLSKLFKEC